MVLFLVIKTLDPEPDPYPDLLEMLDPDPKSMKIRICNTAVNVPELILIQLNDELQ
jgi:hypothetical protein